MTCRTVHPRVGQKISICSASPYEIPRGLFDGQRVRVVRGSNAGVTVEDDSGQQFRVPIQCCEMPSEYFLDGQWLPENHPTVWENLVSLILELETTRDRWPKGIERCNEDNLKRWRIILREHMA